MSDSLDITPEGALQEALARIREPGVKPPDKALVLLLWDETGNYDVRFHNAGMKASEMITLCEVHKAHCLRFMNRAIDDDRPHGEDEP
jgi:hypothetical protein